MAITGTLLPGRHKRSLLFGRVSVATLGEGHRDHASPKVQKQFDICLRFIIKICFSNFFFWKQIN